MEDYIILLALLGDKLWVYENYLCYCCVMANGNTYSCVTNCRQLCKVRDLTFIIGGVEGDLVEKWGVYKNFFVSVP